MFLPMNKSLWLLLQKLEDDKQPTLAELHTAYFAMLKLRSQLLGAIDTMEHYEITAPAVTPLAQQQTCDQMVGGSVVLVIDEPLPQMKELTAALHEHWLELMQSAILQAHGGIKMYRWFPKAFVLIEVVTPKASNNLQLWDTSNRAINLILNNLKGVYFRDDNLEHLAFGVVGSWGEKGATIIHISDWDRLQPLLYGASESS